MAKFREEAQQTFGFVPVRSVVEALRKGMTLGAATLLTVLCGYRNYRTGKCFPSILTLCSDLGSTKKSVIRWRRELKEHGLISYRVTNRGTQYTINGLPRQKDKATLQGDDFYRSLAEA